MLRPRPLRPGAPVAVVAPASPPRDLNRYRNGLARLRSVYDVRTAWAPDRQRGYLAAPDEVRVDALHQAIRDPTIEAIFCVRGGYGCLRLLPRLDWALARQHPTLLVGYSDVTALHLAFHARAGWTGLSGPVVTEWARADDQTLGAFRRMAEGAVPTFADGLSSLSSGTGTGPLLGGNLSVLTRLLGTPYCPDWRGTILVIEDVAEAPYRVDRMLAHLQNSGVLDEVRGVILGHFSASNDAPERPTHLLDTLFDEYFAKRPYPVATNLTYGHLLPRHTLPIGVPARLSTTADGATLDILASAVEP